MGVAASDQSGHSAHHVGSALPEGQPIACWLRARQAFSMPNNRVWAVASRGDLIPIKTDVRWIVRSWVAPSPRGGRPTTCRERAQCLAGGRPDVVCRNRPGNPRRAIVFPAVTAGGHRDLLFDPLFQRPNM